MDSYEGKSDEEKFFKWLSQQMIWTNGGFVSAHFLETMDFETRKQIIIESFDLSLSIKDWDDVPYNWNFLPNLKKLFFDNYKSSELPLLPENLKSLTIRSSHLKRIDTLPKNLKRLVICDNTKLEYINLSQIRQLKYLEIINNNYE